jgi:abortive infection bacteriophage resistance protein
MIPYAKPYLSYELQVELLVARGLGVEDKNAAAQALSQISA